MDLTDTPPTSPATQAGTPQLYRHGSNQGMSATRHPEFYYTDPTLMDPVILQAENTLYRLSLFYLMQGSHFFASTFSIENDNPQEGRSDDRPIVLPPTVTCAAFDVYLRHDKVYDQNPSQETLIQAIGISRQWSIPKLFGYASDHFKRQFSEKKIHPAIVLGVARQYGISDLIEQAVVALAKSKVPFSSWACDPDILCYLGVEDVAVIGKMKEKLLTVRMALCDVPPVDHVATCHKDFRPMCSAAWKSYWLSKVVPRLLALDDEISNLLWWIRLDYVEKAQVLGMGDICLQLTINEVKDNPGWEAEMRIPEGATKMLMVPERTMLEPASG